VHHYIDDFEDFFDDYVMDEKLALHLFTNGLREEVKNNVFMFNLTTLRDAYSLPKLAEVILAYSQPIMIHENIHVEPMDSITECEDLPFTYISMDDVVPVDPIIEYEKIPLTYLSTNDVELMDPIEEYEALPPACIHINDVAFESSILLE